MILSTPEQTPTHRLGTYYLETGYGIRSSEVIYDRKHSAITEYDFSGLDLDELLDGFDWLHLSGITPALASQLPAAGAQQPESRPRQGDDHQL